MPGLQAECMPRGDLRATAAGQWRTRATARGYVLTPRDLHPETVEAQRPRPQRRRIIVLVSKAVACLACDSAQRGACRSVDLLDGRTRAFAREPPYNAN